MSTAAHHAIESYSLQMPPETELCKRFEASLTTITIHEDGFRYNVSVTRATLLSLAKLAERYLLSPTDNRVDKQVDKINKDGEQTTAEGFIGELLEYTVDGIVRHVGKGDSVL